VVATVAAGAVDYATQIAPILAEHCGDCHLDGARKGGLSLSSEAVALAGGDSLHPVYMKGNSAGSEMIARMLSTDPLKRMPPKGDPVPDADVALLRAWIDAGARWGAEAATSGSAARPGGDHWAYQAPVAAALPVADPWVREPIDAFVLARLQAEGLRPAREADRYTLIRRLSLDLTGLPPTPEAVARFVADTTPGTYQRLIDELLASPHYGERMAILWLDAARYADTNGFEKDRPRSIWPYRDWVIDAFNRNMPFDRFTIEQFAGDMLPGATQEQRIATGFLRNTMINEEGGVDQEEYRYEAVVDRANTAGTVFLGLTLACAQCHTHKYDEITQREYFQFMAYLNNADEIEIPVLTPERVAAREAALQAADEAEAALLSHFPVDDATRMVVPLESTQRDAERSAALALAEDGALTATGERAETDQYMLAFALPAGGLSGIQIEAIRDASLPNNGPGRADNGNFVVTDVRARVGAAEGSIPNAIAFARAEADVEQEGFGAAGLIDDKNETGWATNAAPGTARLWFESAIAQAEPGILYVTLGQAFGEGHTLGHFRVTGLREVIPASDEPEDVRRAQHFARKRDAWATEAAKHAVPWTIADPVAMQSKNEVTFVRQDDRSLLVKGNNPNNDVYEITYRTHLKNITAIRLEALPDPSLPGGGPGRGILMTPNEGDFLLSEIAVEAAPWLAPEALQPVVLQNPTEDYAGAGRTAAMTLDGKMDTGWGVANGEGKPHAAVWEVAEPTGHEGGTLLRVTLTQMYIHLHTLGRFRLSVTDAPKPVRASGVPAEIEAALVMAPEARTPEEAQRLDRYFLSIAPELGAEHRRIAQMRADAPKHPTSMVLEERESPRTTRIHHRGEFLHPRDPVTPGMPHVLPPPPAGEAQNRLTLARWLVAEENPLTARVTVNRLWQMIFGRGLVNTPEDFGVRGEAPSHPELLDWLAVEFVRRGWDQKELLRMMVNSATYRQASEVSDDLLERDPVNELLARGPRFRVEGEVVRDIALAASGLWNPEVGGPSVFPPLPPGVLDLVYAGTAWKTSEGADAYRRGLYTFMKRTLPYPSATTFDCPLRDVTVVKRARSNTPLQALTQLNDGVFVQAAAAMAARVLREQPDADTPSRIAHAYMLCLSRPPDAQEIAWVGAFLQEQERRFAAGELSAAELLGEEAGAPDAALRAAWTTLCRVLLNLDETITRG